MPTMPILFHIYIYIRYNTSIYWQESIDNRLSSDANGTSNVWCCSIYMGCSWYHRYATHRAQAYSVHTLILLDKWNAMTRDKIERMKRFRNSSKKDDERIKAIGVSASAKDYFFECYSTAIMNGNTLKMESGSVEWKFSSLTYIRMDDDNDDDEKERWESKMKRKKKKKKKTIMRKAQSCHDDNSIPIGSLLFE